MILIFHHIFTTAEMIGIKASLFSSTSSKGPKKSWEDPMSYPAIKGLTRLSNLTVAEFNNKACVDGAYNYFWMTAPKYGDIFHPMETEKITLVNVHDKSKVG